ncbi:MAG: trypsin-like serine protease [Anaerolineae bacterium]|nr:trypsin-like serine protease [Gloeobacterales cyanobacterium ES-bin-313]
MNKQMLGYLASSTILLGASSAWGEGIYDGAGAISGGCTGVAISPTVVLSAAHCSAGANPATLSFKGIPAIRVDVAPGYISFGQPNLDNDLVAITLASPLPSSIPTYKIYFESAPIGSGIVFIHNNSSVAYNAIDIAPVNDPCAPDPNNTGICTPADPSLPVSFGSTTFAFDFDQPGDTSNLYNYVGGPAVSGEDTLRSGDSGGPTFILVNGIPQLLGINTFVASTPKGSAFGYGSIGGGILLSNYQSFLSSYLPAPTITSFSPSNAPIGTSIIITGSYFTGATAVKINSLSAPFAVNSDTQITATVPSGSTTGLISVTTPSGTATSGVTVLIPGDYSVVTEDASLPVQKALYQYYSGYPTPVTSPAGSPRNPNNRYLPIPANRDTTINCFTGQSACPSQP